MSFLNHFVPDPRRLAPILLMPNPLFADSWDIPSTWAVNVVRDAPSPDHPPGPPLFFLFVPQGSLVADVAGQMWQG